jgi:hypothetical protein
MPQPCKPKVCVDCKKTYTPTSNVQKRCPDCIKTHKYVPANPQPASDKKAVVVHHSASKPQAGNNFAGFLRNLSDNGVTGIVFGDIKISIDKT